MFTATMSGAVASVLTAVRPPAADAAGAGARLSRPMPAAAPAATSPPPTATAAAAAASPTDVVRQAYGAFAAWLAGGGSDPDFAALEDFFADGIVWESNVNGGFKGQGKADLKRFFRWVSQANDIRAFDLRRLIESGREVAVVVEHGGVGRVTGKQYSATMVQLVTLDEAGRITRFKEFVEPAVVEALAGVPFPPAT
ncbi:hypothetical protein HYH02_007066 [Chlamydomonas schloesseri]|uniref:SnoaL-like domain-containing protein n=1 Tax=Chlamydomonas schloesseri TaxID=2026947 RepID=A0A835WIU9_9CHLO|nr:hypothetical protein HYH02_007066 [Chlamydomonas schloesseri]|eukprot:KAG2448039.1 hypothetical protein HYH02_007066 [Chlamydomonas schloesseri]